MVIFYLQLFIYPLNVAFGISPFQRMFHNSRILVLKRKKDNSNNAFFCVKREQRGQSAPSIKKHNYLKSNFRKIKNVYDFYKIV